MALGLTQQIERRLDHLLASKRGVVTHSHREDKARKHRAERRRAKREPECQPRYRRFHGWEW